MFYDTATMEIIVRSVALSAFVEAPREVNIIAARRGGASLPARPEKAAKGHVGRGLGVAVRSLRRALPWAGGRLAGLAELARPARPDDRCPA